MVLKKIVRILLDSFKNIDKWARDEKPALYQKEEAREHKTIVSLWDYFQFAENTQAFHLINVLGFDEWIDMDEIRRRIIELFNAKYKNERSLYPYLKTLVDLGLVETSNIGGRRKWRKRELIINILLKKKKKKIETIAR